ncbi:129aa long hypothetical protein [Pyrococcus horikoshii OT3]|uniref:Uncharacterized protein n=1 Tax=Pyrococcus horikoshii (strain ATCC 700860 / DSM 12428 / JCM 9974 / NBRC 100139 / OT-3) TaxID=70601 RepID=O58342_PYRHO|nr:129aa long hypothetical protein [Pyrococcus horikoshii OT3]
MAETISFLFASSLIFCSSSGDISSSSSSLLMGSMWLTSITFLNVGTFSLFSWITLRIPTTITLSPGIAVSTISSRSIPSMNLGICPPLKLSGLSCILNIWKFTNLLFSTSSWTFLLPHCSHFFTATKPS